MTLAVADSAACQTLMEDVPPAETLQDPVGSAERVSHDQSHDLADEVKTEIQDVDEIVLSDHATTGSETESDVETTVRPKVSYRDIVAPEGTVLHQHCKWKTLRLMKTENRVVFLCGRKTSNMYKVTQTRHALIPQSAVSVSAQSLTETAGQKGFGSFLSFVFVIFNFMLP